MDPDEPFRCITFRFYDIDLFSEDAKIYDIAVNGDNVVWLALGKDGLLKFTNNQWYQYQPEKYSIFGVETSPNGDLWVATFNGLYKFDEPNWQKLNLSHECYTSLIVTGENDYQISLE